MSKLKVVEPDQASFDYSSMSMPVAIKAREAAERIKLRLKRSAEDILAIGKDLLAVKESLPHGSFLPWIEAEFGMSDMTAKRFMQVAKVYGDKSNTVFDLPPTALYELAAPKTPIEVREEIEHMIAGGEVVTAATVKELRAKLEQAEKALADGSNDFLDHTMDNNRRIAELEKENAELLKRAETAAAPAPVQDAPVVDEAAIRLSVAEELDARYEAYIKSLKDELAAAQKQTAEASANTNVTLLRPEFDEESVSARYQARIAELEAKLAEAQSAPEQMRWAPDGPFPSQRAAQIPRRHIVGWVYTRKHQKPLAMPLIASMGISVSERCYGPLLL